jgi:hypothetical protein
MKTVRVPILLLSAIVLLALPMAASAWSAFGHRLVAALAAAQLSPQARAQVAELLQDEKDPSLPGIAAWADQLRDNDPDLGKRTSKWHYVNLPKGDCSYAPARDCPGGDCLVEAIRRQTQILSDRSRPRADRAQALKFVVHFIGDVHQPLHAGFGHDRGGNDVQVNVDGKGSNLHTLWDRLLLQSSGLDEARYLAHLQKAPPPGPRHGTVEDWARESCAIVATAGFYPPRAKIDPAYMERWRPVAEQRLRIGGQRLAQVLNEALGDTGR